MKIQSEKDLVKIRDEQRKSLYCPDFLKVNIIQQSQVIVRVQVFRVEVDRPLVVVTRPFDFSLL